MMTAISSIECLFDDLINYLPNGRQFSVKKVFSDENKVFPLFMEANEWRRGFSQIFTLFHNVQLVLFSKN